MSNDRVFQALADPTRRRILRMLHEGDKSAGQIAEQFSMTSPSMSHHFNVLKTADLISGRRDGQQIIYSLNTSVVQDLLTMLLNTFGAKPIKAENS